MGINLYAKPGVKIWSKNDSKAGVVLNHQTGDIK